MLSTNRFLVRFLCGFSFLFFVLFGLNLYQSHGLIEFNTPFVAALLSLILVFAVLGVLYAYIRHVLTGNTDPHRERMWANVYFVVVQNLGLFNGAVFMYYYLLAWKSSVLPLRTFALIYAAVWLGMLVPICLYRIFKRVPDSEKQATGDGKPADNQ